MYCSSVVSYQRVEGLGVSAFGSRKRGSWRQDGSFSSVEDGEPLVLWTCTHVLVAEVGIAASTCCEKKFRG